MNPTREVLLASLQEGKRVEITLIDGKKYKGTVVELNKKSILLKERVNPTSSRLIQYDQISRARLIQRRMPWWTVYAAIGGAIATVLLIVPRD